MSLACQLIQSQKYGFLDPPNGEGLHLCPHKNRRRRTRAGDQEDLGGKGSTAWTVFLDSQTQYSNNLSSAVVTIVLPNILVRGIPG